MTSPLPLHTAAQARAMDAAAVETLGIAAYELMGRAGAAAWSLLHRRWPQARRIGVACGPGNNGGDGYVLARLARAAGCQVQVLVGPDGAPRTEEAKRAWNAWREDGGVTRVFDGQLPEVDLWVDALFGTGLARGMHGVAQAMIERINATHLPVLALDLPSGLDGDRGHAERDCIRADATITFLAAKRGLYTGQGRDAAGEVSYDALGLPTDFLARFPSSATWFGPDALADGLAPRHANAHKGEHGHVLCIGGEMGMGGAVRLCAEAALRAGADALAPLLQRASVLAVGPGLGRGEGGRELFEAAVASGKPLILDADGLVLLSMHPRPLPQAILTPHPGEAARLLGMGNQEVQADRFDAVSRLAEKFQCVVVLKGAGTLVAAPGETTAVIGAGNPGMATGGMGDVLTGVVAALHAQGLSNFRAAVVGALLHGAAGDAAARVDGERGLLPSDLFPHLRRLANPE